ncbi:glycerol-3-phosphate 1-O-acyltransferase PlsY [Leptolyngbya sp. BC1307]|uniref:glycerol-3-phosphate 1-O-acyltransferase PlsY n=1 Tax=Leptolyngbya sp. BC1307 TaxID=2029589 RepID=UPI000EFCBF15|nr:glycerol-3-phosphate 1-O-acyltransferase PlsY [Leptolyngbya sp. BC1307]
MSGSTLAILLLGLLGAYLLGSIPTGFLLTKALLGVDIREHGSGNTGATNVFRVVGKAAGTAALLIDLVKGLLAVTGMIWLVATALRGQIPLAWEPWTHVLAAFLALLGHSKSVWLGFTGGKSAATGLGVLLALAWPVGLGTAAVFAVALGVSRTVSVGSIAAALSATVFMLVTQQPTAYVLLAIAGGCYVVYRHHSNIARLFAGTEPKTFGN